MKLQSITALLGALLFSTPTLAAPEALTGAALLEQVVITSQNVINGRAAIDGCFPKPGNRLERDIRHQLRVDPNCPSVQHAARGFFRVCEEERCTVFGGKRIRTIETFDINKSPAAVQHFAHLIAQGSTRLSVNDLARSIAYWGRQTYESSKLYAVFGYHFIERPGLFTRLDRHNVCDKVALTAKFEQLKQESLTLSYLTSAVATELLTPAAAPRKPPVTVIPTPAPDNRGPEEAMSQFMSKEPVVSNTVEPVVPVEGTQRSIMKTVPTR